MKTITEAQEKNHTVPTDLFPRTPLGQLMRRAVTYMHQVGADGTNAPHPSKRKLLITFGSPRVYWFKKTKVQLFEASKLHTTRLFFVDAKSFIEIM
jgi:hypothetical protein